MYSSRVVTHILMATTTIPASGGVLPPARVHVAARVLVAAPFTPGTTAEGVAAWQAVARREVESRGDVALFAISATIDTGAARPSLDVPGVSVLVVERDANPAQAAVSQAVTRKILGRIRLTRKASEARASIVWFLDLDIRPPVGGWSALRDELEAGAGAALIPYPLAELDSNPGVVVIGRNTRGDKVLMLVDSWTRPAEAGRTSFPAAGGGFGCVAIPLSTFLVVKFAVATLDAVVLGGNPEPEKIVLSGEALGWYVNALRARVPIRAVAGAVCRVT